MATRLLIGRWLDFHHLKINSISIDPLKIIFPNRPKFTKLTLEIKIKWVQQRIIDINIKTKEEFINKFSM